MEKKEKKSDLEQLLNSLIEKGWKPFGKQLKRGEIVRIDEHWWQYYYSYYNKNQHYGFLNRQIVSKESGLWQFVCENGMVKEQKEEKLIEVYDNLRGRTETVYDDEKYEYRLIESALCDEDKLEDFLLSNIKVEGE